jgi:hypothetical protein
MATPLAQSMAEPPPTAMSPSQRPLRYSSTAARTAASVGLEGVPSNTDTSRSAMASSAFCSTPAARTPASVTISGRFMPMRAHSAAQQLDGAEFELDLGEVLDEGHGCGVLGECGGQYDCRPAKSNKSEPSCPRKKPLPLSRREHRTRIPEGLTPKMASVVERMARAGHPPLNQLTPEAAKAAYEKGAGVLEVPKPALARIEDFGIAARDGFTLPARLYAPSATCCRCWCISTAAASRSATSARTTRCAAC